MLSDNVHVLLAVPGRLAGKAVQVAAAGLPLPL